MAKILGRNTVAGWRKTGGTGDAARLFQTSFSVDPVTESIESDVLAGGRYSTDQLITKIHGEGSIGLELTHAMLDQIINKWITPNADAFSEKFDVYHNYTAGYQRIFKECGVDSFTLNLAKKSYIKADLNIVAKEVEFSPTTPVVIAALTSDAKLQCFDVTAIKFFTGDVGNEDDIIATVDTLKLTFNNNVDKDDQQLNQKGLRTVEAQASTITVDLECEMSTGTYDKYIDFLVANADVTDMTIAIGAHTLTIYKQKIKDVKAPVSGKDKVTLSISSTALFSTADSKILDYV